MNLFIAVIMQAYEESVKAERGTLKPQDFDQFKILWKKYDPDGTSLIFHEDFEKLIIELDPPLGKIAFKLRLYERKKFLFQLKLPLYLKHDNKSGKMRNFHYFHDAIIALGKHALQQAKGVNEDLE